MSVRFSAVLFAIFVGLCAPLVAAENAAPAPELTDALRKLLIASCQAGGHPNALITFKGEKGAATLKNADEKGLVIEMQGLEFPLQAWKDVPAPTLLAFGEKLAKTAPEFTLVAQGYAALAQNQQAEKACMAALELDKEYAAAKEVLRSLKDPEVKALPKPVIVAAPANGDPAAPTPASPIARAPLPKFAKPVNFDSPEADAILAATQVFPPNNPWNEDISKLPVLPDSDKLVKSVGADTFLHVDVGENFVIVPPDQPRVPVKIIDLPQQAGPGPYPMPDLPPIQGWGLGKERLEDMLKTGEGDRHILVLDPVNAKLYEFYHCYKKDSGWEASGEATFDLTSNKARPKNWCSADAAGLAMFPGIIKFHELAAGNIPHAIRLTVSKTRKAFIWPATHPYAGHTDDPAFPAMGQRYRLKASFDVSKLPPHARTIAIALQKYGAIVADNGRDWDLCCTPDKRIEYEQLRAVNKAIKGSDMEAIVTTGENEGPRR